MKEKTKAYMAGIMDADGCFSISFRKTSSGGPHYEPHIIFTSNFPGLGKYAVKHFGGSCTHHKTKGYFHWQLFGRQAMLSFLTSLTPYLVEKREQAEILIDYINLNGRPNPEIREKMYTRIKELKHQECVTTDTLDTFGSKKTDHAYLAGIFDGEGSISIHQHRRRGGDLHYVRFISVTNTFLPVLNCFAKAYGGTIREKSQPGKKCYEWNLRDKKSVENFLLCVLPYLIVKRQRALLMLKLVRLDGHHPDERLAIYEEFRNLVTTKNAKVKIQSDLHGDMQSAPAETLTA